MQIQLPSHLTDTALVAEIARLSRGERDAMVQLVTYLAELDRRRLYLPAGYSSLYTYCRNELLLSEPEAYIRMKAARAVRRFPGVLPMLANGSLNLTTLRRLLPYMNRRNHEQLLGAAAGKSKRQVTELLARLYPKPDVKATIRRLPGMTGRGGAAGEAQSGVAQPPNTGDGSATEASALSGERPTAPLQAVQPDDRPLTAPPPTSFTPLATPLSVDRYRITFTASGAIRDKLELARDMLGHAVPSGDPAAIIDRALTVLLEDLASRKFAATDEPRRGRGAAGQSRHILAGVKRAVWIRDLGRCAFVGRNGRRCGERHRLEFHHLMPFAEGGQATVENIALRCRAHNQYEDDVHYGPKPAEDAVRESIATYRVDRRTNWVRTQLTQRRGERGAGGMVAGRGRTEAPLLT
jgi:hypothetical protein